MPVSRFTTDAFAPRHRHEAWRARDWPTIGPIFETTPAGAFFNHADRFVVDGIVAHVSRMGGQSYLRTAASARRDGVDHLIVSLPVTGSMLGDSDGRAVHGHRGTLAVTDLSRPHAHRSSDSDTIMLTIPRATAAAAGLDARALHGTVVQGAAVEVLRDHVASLHRNATRILPAPPGVLGGTVMALLGFALSGGGGVALPAPDHAERALLVRARHAIDRDLARPSLGVVALCVELGVSRSSLYRLFEPLGGVAAYIRTQRLEAARRLLANGRTAAIGDIAQRVGFADPAHFSRAFRAHFGEAPRDLRGRDG